MGMRFEVSALRRQQPVVVLITRILVPTATVFLRPLSYFDLKNAESRYAGARVGERFS